MRIIDRNSILAIALLSLVSISVLGADQSAAEERLSQELARIVTNKRQELGLVGLGAMMMVDGKIIGAAVSGERKYRSGVQITEQDKWHIGSITKSMTATMIARLVEQGDLRWDTTIGDVFTDSGDIAEEWQKVTLSQLLTHRSGARRDFSTFFGLTIEFGQEIPLTNKREDAVKQYLKKEMPSSPAGSEYSYSNVGIIIAGVMAEKITGVSWEELMRTEVFQPLKMEGAGFGSPQDVDYELEQPRGHRSFLGFIMAASPDSDVPDTYGPAGRVHLTLKDLLIFGNDHLRGESGRGKLLESGTYKFLHNPVPTKQEFGYGHGWAISPPEDWANGPIIWHNGSNRLWYALLVILPGRDAVIAVTSNDRRGYSGEDIAWSAAKQAARLLDAHE